jgi:hypothetical protein
MKIKGNIASLEHLDIDLLFPFSFGDNILRRHRGILKPLAQKQNHLKHKAIRHMHI